ncbi:hypothetical protein ACP70R_011039 [Stipagrostis hirtigluma subsp. patula]
MSSNAGPTVAVKLFIDEEKQRVLFAESDKEFVDVVFSFLTLPLGSIVRVLGKQSEVGCLDEIYKSVENLSIDHFQTKACKTMLLRPLNAAASECDRLKVKVDDTNPRAIYVCPNSSCQISCSYCSVYDAVCKSCGCSLYLKEVPLNAAVGNSEDVFFVQNGMKLIVTDDLHVYPASTSIVLSLLDKFGLQEEDNIEEKNLELNSNKITSLLKRVLLSKQPLTGLYFDVALTPDAVILDQLSEEMFPKQSKDGNHKFIPIKIKLVQTKDHTSVLYAEAGQDFIDIVFGLLSVPVGSIVKAYGQWSPNGCVDNLYRSTDGSARGCMKEECRTLLLSPKFAPFFGCTTNVLQVDELHPRVLLFKYLKCFRTHGWTSTCYCSQPLGATLMNPKSLGSADATTRAYIKGGPRNFIVTNDLRVLHFSIANTLHVLRAAKIPKDKKLVEQEVTLDRIQVLKLLRAAVFTREVLSSVLLPPKKKWHPHH